MVAQATVPIVPSSQSHLRTAPIDPTSEFSDLLNSVCPPEARSQSPCRASGVITAASCAATLGCLGRRLIGPLREVKLLAHDGQLDTAEFHE